jgi:beta-phosphoglucomutase
MPAIVFDFDGVLVDSEPVHEAAIRATVRGLGMDFSARDYREKYLGLDDRDIFRAVARAHGRSMSQDELEGVAKTKWEHTRRAFNDGLAAPLPGAVELFRTAASMCPVAICSGAMRQEIDLVLARLELTGLARVIVSADDVAQSKPDPESYRLAISRLGLAPKVCMAIEDTDKGVASAQGAGLKVVAISTSMSPAELRAADLVVPSARALSVPSLLAMLE